MQRINIQGIFGDEVKDIELGEVTGIDSIWWSVMIARRVYGSIHYCYKKWVIELRPEYEFCYEDEQIMIELVAARYPEILNS